MYREPQFIYNCNDPNLEWSVLLTRPCAASSTCVYLEIGGAPRCTSVHNLSVKEPFQPTTDDPGVCSIHSDTRIHGLEVISWFNYVLFREASQHRRLQTCQLLKIVWCSTFRGDARWRTAVWYLHRCAGFFVLFGKCLFKKGVFLCFISKFRRNSDWSPHIDFITSKASNTLSFLRRNLRSCPQSLRELAYISLVRSKLDYAAATWDPYQVGHTQNIERIQRRAARFVCNNYSYYSSVTSMISTLGWTDLASRRKDLRLALFYKTVFGLLAVATEDILLCADSRTRASHRYKYSTIRANTEPYRQSFFPRTIPEWNILPPSIAEAPSIDTFKARLNPSAAPTTRRAASPEPTISCI